MNLGMPEIILILVVALLFFGPSRLPSLGKSVGEAIRGFKKGIAGSTEEEKERAREKLQGSGRGSAPESLVSEATEKKKDTTEA